MQYAGKRGKLAAETPRTGSLSEYFRQSGMRTPWSFDNGYKVDAYATGPGDEYPMSPLVTALNFLQVAYAEVGETFYCPSDFEVESTYFDCTDGDDNGLSIPEVLDAWLEDGLWGNQIVAYVPINIKNLRELTEACHTFGAIILGAEMPSVAEQQFESRESWHVTERDYDSTGGHAFIATGANRFGMDLVTWGERHSMTWGWWEKYGSEAWAVVPELYIEANHSSIWSLDVASLQSDLED